MFPEELLGIFSALPQALPFIGKPGTAFFNQLPFDGLIEKIAYIRNALVVDDVEFSVLERRCELILYDLYPCSVANVLGPFFNGTDPANIDTNGGLKF